MWLENHPYLQIYFLGCILAAFLYIFSVVLFYFINWITKNNIVLKNLKKIDEPPQPLLDRVGGYVVLILFDFALSWISVLLNIFNTTYNLFKIFRDLLSSVPEEIKLLRFPLRNNPNLSREAVWAYGTALGIKNGGQWDGFAQREQLNNLKELYPSFNCSEALKIFKSLKIVDSETVGEWFE